MTIAAKNSSPSGRGRWLVGGLFSASNAKDKFP
jgi:hypothetical protein